MVKKEGVDVSAEDVLDHLKPLIAKWWMPDLIVFKPEIPHGATGKILKTELREELKDALQDAS